MFFLIIITALLAGIVQGVTGFGSGIVLMLLLPYLFALPQAAGVSTAICLFLSGSMVLMYRQYVNVKKIVPPACLYLMVCSITIHFSTYVNQVLMKKVFGGFLIVLAIYYLCFASQNKQQLSLPVAILFIIVSAICDGLFGIGGPLMVIFFMSQTHSTHEYLGTIQGFFFFNGVYNTIFRIVKGIIQIQVLPYILLGMIGIVTGGILAKKMVDRINGNLIRKITYVTIGISGLLNLLM